MCVISLFFGVQLQSQLPIMLYVCTNLHVHQKKNISALNFRQYRINLFVLAAELVTFILANYFDYLGKYESNIWKWLAKNA